MQTNTSPVTVIGLGPMGATMAETFLKAGHPVTVWNRTASKADPLVAQGATLAATPAEALAANELIVISQTHYQAMYDSLGTATEALEGKVLVNLSSDTPEVLRAAGRWASEHGAELLTGGIMVPPPGIGQPGAFTFYSGPEALLERHGETLKALSDTTYMGDDPGLAMLFYQASLFMFWSATSSYMHALAMLGSAGIAPEAFLPYAAGLYSDLASDGPMGYLKILTREVSAGQYPGGDNSLRMQAVGADHLVEASRDAGVDTAYPKALRDLFWRTVEMGHGDGGVSSVLEAMKKPVA
ncbi:NAD(P)-dependent oxidoreductase [Actinomadura barringtoniae]|uniref:NAD(P)-dependent oxidoreductase n=1 Tax=Actinomadura barringtoniae TaxID=1427535 RepID=A0A939T8D1_9ACTN|nr:NAD(P)-binding domain-containing protein [Actinomadura barringtoniae]MBO2453009.1 NAD(P)-dependent oxidoreductase [Actinomadura barringtoniae]